MPTHVDGDAKIINRNPYQEMRSLKYLQLRQDAAKNYHFRVACGK